MKKQNMKNQRGITLISLVVIIIVLLIIAGISVAVMSGNNGMIIKAAEASDETKIADDIERIRASYSALTMSKLKVADGRKYSITADEIQTQILSDMKLDSGVIVDGTFEDGYTVAMPSGNSYSLNNKGDVKWTGVTVSAEEPSTSASAGVED